MKKLNKVVVMLMVTVLFFSMTSCHSLSRDKDAETQLIKGSPYYYEDEDGLQFELFFNEDRSFSCDYIEGSWQDPDVYMNIHGQWRVITLNNIVCKIIELEYDLRTLSPYDKESYDYFSEENRVLRMNNKKGNAYGFGPGIIENNYDFVGWDSDNPHKVIFHSIGGEYCE